MSGFAIAITTQHFTNQEVVSKLPVGFGFRTYSTATIFEFSVRYIATVSTVDGKLALVVGVGVFAGDERPIDYNTIQIMKYNKCLEVSFQ